MAPPGPVAPEVRLPTLLSQALVAFTIEFDNEAERRLAHRTTTSSPSRDGRLGPWLVSMVMWPNFMRYLEREGTSLAHVAELAGVENPNVPGLERWGYIVVAPDPGDGRQKPPRRHWLARPTAAGLRAQEVWAPLASEIESRWRTRFGGDDMHRLRGLLCTLAQGSLGVMPDHVPVLGYGLWSKNALVERRRPRPAPPTPAPELSALLAAVLLQWTVDFETASDLSLAICANVLRVLDTVGVPVRDLPSLVGISKEAVAVSVGYLERTGYAVIGGDPTAPVKAARLTDEGRRAQARSISQHALVGRNWTERYGPETIKALEDALADILTRTDAHGDAVLAEGLVPHPDGWRAKKPYLSQTERLLRRPSDALPHFPMVTHRGGYPDGS